MACRLFARHALAAPRMNAARGELWDAGYILRRSLGSASRQALAVRDAAVVLADINVEMLTQPAEPPTT